MLIKQVIFHNTSKIMPFKIFNLNHCRKVKFLLLNKLHQILLNRKEWELPSQKKEKELDGGITMGPDLIQKVPKLVWLLLKGEVEEV